MSKRREGSWISNLLHQSSFVSTACSLLRCSYEAAYGGHDDRNHFSMADFELYPCPGKGILSFAMLSLSSCCEAWQ